MKKILVFIIMILGSSSLFAMSKCNINDKIKQINKIPKKTLSSIEKKELKLMLEEEKLAHDIYKNLYKQYNLKIFKNIARSEKIHMNILKTLIKKYNINFKLYNKEKFHDINIQNLYYKLLSKGIISKRKALKVGKDIEILDIKDLEERLKNTDNKDIKLAYKLLKKGSEHHLKAFNKWLKKYN